MPEILPVSELRSYTDVLAKVGDGSPVFLTRNGRGAYAILTMEDYDRVTARQTRSPRSQRAGLGRARGLGTGGGCSHALRGKSGGDRVRQRGITPDGPPTSN